MRPPLEDTWFFADPGSMGVASRKGLHAISADTVRNAEGGSRDMATYRQTKSAAAHGRIPLQQTPSTRERALLVLLIGGAPEEMLSPTYLFLCPGTY